MHPMIRMINNTQNGYADAYSESEAADLEAKGWSRHTPTPKPTSVQVDMTDAFKRIDTPKRGRPFKRNEINE